MLFPQIIAHSNKDEITAGTEKSQPAKALKSKLKF
jgi:hypothetical protein